jgi:predicted molibdopterin-dependent oxidoreductase YjgC
LRLRLQHHPAYPWRQGDQGHLPARDNHNRGWLCVKGRFGYEFINSKDRLTTPLIRREKGGELEPAGWDEALDLVGRGLTAIKEQHGGDALAGLASARCTNEENYLFPEADAGGARHQQRRSLRPLLTQRHGGRSGREIRFRSNDQLGCRDRRRNQALLVIGSNTTENHPIIALRMKEAVRRCQADRRRSARIPLVKFATLWLRHKPGTDSVLLNAMMHVILAEGLEDRDFIAERTEGLCRLCRGAEGFTPDYAATITGVPAEISARPPGSTQRPAAPASIMPWALPSTSSAPIMSMPWAIWPAHRQSRQTLGRRQSAAGPE